MIRRTWKWARGVFYRGSHRTGIRPVTDPPAPAPDEAEYALHQEACGPAGAGVPDSIFDYPVPGRYQPSAGLVLSALVQRQWPDPVHPR